MTTLHWARLTIAADQLDDAERLRIATVNRLAAIERDKGLSGSPEAKALEEQAKTLKEVERIAVRELTQAMRAHPLGDWCRSQIGVGEKTLGRLLGIIGDPAMRVDPETGEVTARSLGQLRSYCGYGDAAAQRRRRGQQANWNAEARKRLYLIAVACMRQSSSPYRAVYEEARAKYADCDISDLHKHNRALRAISKAFLKDLWEEARGIHVDCDPHTSHGPSGSRGVAA